MFAFGGLVGLMGGAVVEAVCVCLCWLGVDKGVLSCSPLNFLSQSFTPIIQCELQGSFCLFPQSWELQMCTACRERQLTGCSSTGPTHMATLNNVCNSGPRRGDALLAFMEPHVSCTNMNANKTLIHRKITTTKKQNLDLFVFWDEVSLYSPRRSKLCKPGWLNSEEICPPLSPKFWD